MVTMDVVLAYFKAQFRYFHENAEEKKGSPVKKTGNPRGILYGKVSDTNLKK
jgi:hypothetical protein